VSVGLAEARRLLVQIAATAPLTGFDASDPAEHTLFTARRFELEDPSNRANLRSGESQSGRGSSRRGASSQSSTRRERDDRLGTSRNDRTQGRRDRLRSGSRSRRERDREPAPPIGGGGGGATPTNSDITITVNTNQPSAGVASYVPVQGYSNGFGAGSAMGHWDESIFGSELMTPRLNAGANNLSSISVGLLNDLGYNVDYSGSLSGASSDPGRRFNISISFSGTEANRQTFESYFLEAASFWERYIYSGAFTNGDSSDLTIYASMFYSESLVLGSAGPTAGLTNTNRTAFQASEGVVNLNSYYYTPESLRDPTRSVAFTATIRHEIGHVLGIGTFWPNGSLYGVGEPTSTSSSTFADYAFIGANAVREYNALITDNTYSAPTSLLAPGESNTALR